MNRNILYILDLDRTISDVNKVMEITKQVCEELGIDFDQIYKDQQDLQARGTAYSPFKFIADHHSDTEIFKARFCELAANNRLLFPDSADLLKRLNSGGYDYMFLTHGVDDDWQKLKLQAAGLIKKPYVIVKDRYKSRVIAGWVQGNYLKPELDGLHEYEKFVFVDDRGEAFIDFPSQIGAGFLIDRFSKFTEDLKLPKNVIKIKDLSEVNVS
ncbi:hypothetical protein HZB74_02290 [Candidatus Saccharibacteria bacterium]|nr:hypothetical protein [Candidatus Saccharibacteria bacterium]